MRQDSQTETNGRIERDAAPGGNRGRSNKMAKIRQIKDRNEICNLPCRIGPCHVREMYRYFILGIQGDRLDLSTNSRQELLFTPRESPFSISSPCPHFITEQLHSSPPFRMTCTPPNDSTPMQRKAPGTTRAFLLVAGGLDSCPFAVSTAGYTP